MSETESEDDGTQARDNVRPRNDVERIDREDPDVFLDVPKVEVDTITLQVDDLRAKVSLQVEVLDMVKLSVGADVELGKVDLRLEGVEAQAFLKVHLKNVREIVQEVLRTVDDNPELVRKLATTVEDTATATAAGVGETVGRSAKQLGPSGTSPAVEADSTVRHVRHRGQQVAHTAGRYARTAGRVARSAAGRTRAKVGSLVRDRRREQPS